MNTKNILIESAIEVLNENASCSMDVVAEKAGVTRRTLHRYFQSREHLIQDCLELIMTNTLTDVEAVIKTNGTPIEQLRQMFYNDVRKGKHFEFFQKFSEHLTESNSHSDMEEMGKLFYKLLDQLKLENVIETTLSNEWITYVWMGMVRSANQALKDGAVAPIKVNELAWNAFSKGMVKNSDK